MSSVTGRFLCCLAVLIANAASAADSSTLYLYDSRGNLIGMTDPSVDPNNCGGAGNVCSDENVATRECSGGVCSGRCALHYGDCNHDKQHGCEKLLEDLKTCGDCDTSCSNNHRSSVQCLPDGWTYSCFGDCDADYADCNKNPNDGCETYLVGDVNHCGSCNACQTAPNYKATCPARECKYACVAGYADCNGVFEDGCETPTTADKYHCGNCQPCSANHVVNSDCRSSKCTGTCEPGFGHCGGTFQANGCETDLTSDEDHCGSCENSCPSDPHGKRVCNKTGNSGACGLICDFAYGYADPVVGYGGVITTPARCLACPGVANGFAVSTNNVCGLQCNPGYGLTSTTTTDTGYGGVDPTTTTTFSCIDVLGDKKNCGQVGWACPGTAHGSAVCSGGVCGLTCNRGYGLSGGVCIDIFNDARNCGGVGNVCPATANGYPTCANGTCGLGCNSGYALSGGACIDILNDPSNCGGVRNVCPGLTYGFGTCSSGVCGYGCNSGYGLKATTTTVTGYGGSSTTTTTYSCINIATDAKNCGGVGYVCPGIGNGYAYCSGGVCGTSCNSGYSRCGSTCYALSSDLNNCGACGNVCPSISGGSRSCSSGTCRVTCPSGYTACGTACRSLSNDLNNCGSCGHVCTASGPAGKRCYSGKCQTCSSGYGGTVTCY